MDRNPELLAAALPPLLEQLPTGDMLQLARTCKALRAAVAVAWRRRRVRAVLVASLSNKLLLLDPHSGSIKRHVEVAQLPEDANQPEGGGSWPPCVAVDTAGQRCFVSQYEGSCVLEYSLRDLRLVRRLDCRQLTGAGLAEPEGIVYAHNTLYVAWLLDMAISATPMEALPPPTAAATAEVHGAAPAAAAAAAAVAAPAHAVEAAAAAGAAAAGVAAPHPDGAAAGGVLPALAAAAGAAAQQPEQPEGQGALQAAALAVPQQALVGAMAHAVGQQALVGPPAGQPLGAPLQVARRRMIRRPPGQAQWIFWDMRLGPDNALYVAANPPYLREGACYGDVPDQPGRGFVARLALDEQGQLRGNMTRFTRGAALSRPSGLCFDDAGDLYVTHMACQVVKFGGPHRGEATGHPLHVFIDCTLPQHRLTPDPQAFRPCPVDLCFHDGLFYLTTHTTAEDEPSHGCLSVWDRHGGQVAAHALGDGCRHPNGLAVFPA